MFGSIMQSGVVIVILSVAQVGIKVLPQLRRTLVDLHRGELVTVLKVLLELGRGASHLPPGIRTASTAICQETLPSTSHLVGCVMKKQRNF